MTSFLSLKGTLQKVQSDIKASLNSFASPKKKVEGFVIAKDGDELNLDAGADLLHKFHTNWIQIHRTSEENAKQAEGVDAVISALYLDTEQRVIALDQLNKELNQLPDLTEMLLGVSNLVGQLDKTIESIEAELTMLEDVCDQQDLIRNRESHLLQLASYEESKKAEVDKLRVVLAQEHANKVASHEKNQVLKLKDRQEAFSMAFAEDMEHYMRTGRTERLPSVGSDHQVDIGDIKPLDEDRSVLDEFFDDETNMAGSGSKKVIETESEDAVETVDDGETLRNGTNNKDTSSYEEIKSGT